MIMFTIKPVIVASLLALLPLYMSSAPVLRIGGVIVLSTSCEPTVEASLAQEFHHHPRHPRLLRQLLISQTRHIRIIRQARRNHPHHRHQCLHVVDVLLSHVDELFAAAAAGVGDDSSPQ